MRKIEEICPRDFPAKNRRVLRDDDPTLSRPGSLQMAGNGCFVPEIDLTFSEILSTVQRVEHVCGAPKKAGAFMKIRLSGVVAVGALAISTLVAASAQAAVFDFSYTFGDGSVATGVGEGTVQADGNTIDLFTVASFTVDGQSIDPAVAVSSGHSSPAIATFDGSFMDLLITDSTITFGLNLRSTQNLATIAPPPVGPPVHEIYDPAHWSITETAVPEPATWAMMGLGFAGIGALAYRARRKATVAA
jgi:PEP-CTERM motif